MRASRCDQPRMFSWDSQLPGVLSPLQQSSLHVELRFQPGRSWEAGAQEAGAREAGDREAGVWETGAWGAGAWEAGDWKAGSWEAGAQRQEPGGRSPEGRSPEGRSPGGRSWESGLPITFSSLVWYSRDPGSSAELSRRLWTSHSIFPMTRGAHCHFPS